MTNIVWCMAYKRGVGGGVYAKWACKSIAIGQALQVGGAWKEDWLPQWSFEVKQYLVRALCRDWTRVKARSSRCAGRICYRKGSSRLARAHLWLRYAYYESLRTPSNALLHRRSMTSPALSGTARPTIVCVCVCVCTYIHI